MGFDFPALRCVGLTNHAIGERLYLLIRCGCHWAVQQASGRRPAFLFLMGWLRSLMHRSTKITHMIGNFIGRPGRYSTSARDAFDGRTEALSVRGRGSG